MAPLDCKVRDPIPEGGLSGGAGLGGRGGRPRPVLGRGLADPVVGGGAFDVERLGLERFGLSSLPSQGFSVHQAIIAVDAVILR